MSAPSAELRGRLFGRHAIVTGAANGIGLATAQRFAAEGASVALVDIEEAPLRIATKKIVATGQTALPIVADVRDEAALAAAVDEAEGVLGGLDLAVANAAIEPADDGRADRLDPTVWRRVIDTNLTGTFLTCKFALQALLRSKAEDRCLICTVSPTGARGSAPGQDAYSASKGGVLALMRVLAHDYAREGIRVNGVMPGFTDTRANAAILGDDDLRAQALATIPLGRVGEPREVAALMAWVGSAEARYCTGGVFVSDGGQTAI